MIAYILSMLFLFMGFYSSIGWYDEFSGPYMRDHAFDCFIISAIFYVASALEQIKKNMKYVKFKNSSKKEG